MNWLNWAGALLRHIRYARKKEHEAEEADDVESPETWLSLDYVHEQVQTQLEIQSKDWEAIDNRLRLILGVISIVFAAAAAFQRAGSSSGGSPLPFLVGTVAIMAVVLFLVAAAIATWAYWPYDFDRPPKPHELRELYLTTDPREVKLTVIDIILLAYTENAQIIERKITAFKQAFSLTAIATILLGIGLMAQVACQTAAPTWLWWPFEHAGC
ncbi:MAG: hypothetical protein IT307_14060 [Chloroflexi bacterium]|nr:hypothetical protein [Chloroflexota bacterium]